MTGRSCSTTQSVPVTPWLRSVALTWSCQAGASAAGESHPPKVGEVMKRHTGGLSQIFCALGGQDHPHGFLDRENAVDVAIDGAVAQQRHVEFAESERDQLVSAARMA